MKVIALDLDDVLARFSRHLLEFCNLTYGESLQMSQFTDTNYEKTWSISREEVTLRVRAFIAGGHDKKVLPRTGSQKFVKKLAKTHNLHVITNRPVQIRDTTLWWLNKYFLDCFTEVHFCSDNDNIARCKSSVCKQIGAIFLLDDHPDNAIRCATAGVHVYLFDRPWNQQEFPLLPGVIVRVSSWEDAILETLLQ